MAKGLKRQVKEDTLGKLRKGPLRWFGGKSNLLSKLLPLAPEHTSYVEVFAGGAALFFAKSPSCREVINDLDPGLVNFYRVLQDPEMFERLHAMMLLTPYSRAEYEFCKRSWAEAHDPVERAFRWFVSAQQCHGGVFGSGFAIAIDQSRRGMSQKVAGYLSAIERLPQASERMRNVEINQCDFREVLETYDSPDTFFYLDPPYIHSTRRGKRYYAHEMSDHDHEDMVSLLLKIRGSGMLSGYAHRIYQPLERCGWKRRDFRATCAISARRKPSDGNEGSGARVESVWIRSR